MRSPLHREKSEILKYEFFHESPNVNTRSPLPALRILLFLLLIAFFLLETGCNRHFQADNGPVPPIDSALDTDGARTDRFKKTTAENKRLLDAFETNPCGYLELSGSTHFFNVTGEVTSRVLPGSEIRMFITPNTSLDHSLHIVRVCPPLWRARVDEDEEFVISDVPPGEYVLHLPIDSFPEGTQGFPIPQELQEKDHRLVVVFQGGDPSNSLGVFRIERMHSNRSS